MGERENALNLFAFDSKHLKFANILLITLLLCFFKGNISLSNYLLLWAGSYFKGYILMHSFFQKIFVEHPFCARVSVLGAGCQDELYLNPSLKELRI